ncbi:hypothetical protein Tco_0190592 [Tanacetum coccineum]
MTKVIKGEFEKLEDLMVKDVSLTCGTSLEVFNNEFSRMSRMGDDLFTYEVKVANIPCNSNKDDSKQRIRGDDEVEVTDEESSDNEYEVAEVFRIDTNIFDFETPMCKTFKEFNYLLQIDPDLLTKDIEGFKTYEEFKDDWIYGWNNDVPWVDEKPWTDIGVWKGRKPVKHTCKPFNYKTGYSEWPTCYWKSDGYSLEDSKLKEDALRNKAIIEGLIDDDNDDESRYERKKRWYVLSDMNHDHEHEIDHEADDREELCEIHELSVCNIRRFEMIKYSFGQDEEYVVVKEDEYNDLGRTNEDACRAYQEIFRMIDEGWMIVMKNPNPLNERNEAIPEENPVIPDPNQVVDVHDPNKMVDIPDDVDLVDYDGDDKETPNEDPKEDPEEEPEPNNGLVNRFSPHVDPHQPGVMIGWLEENDGVNEGFNNEDIEDEDVEIELNDDAELIFPYEVEGDKTAPPRDESSDSKPPNAEPPNAESSDSVSSDSESSDFESEDEEADIAPEATVRTVTQRPFAVRDFSRGILEVGESSSARDSSYVGGLAPWALRRDLETSHLRARLTEAELSTNQAKIVLLKLKEVLESGEKATLKKRLTKTETKLEWARMERDIAEGRLHESRVWNKRFYMEMVRIRVVPKPPSDDEGTERPRKKSKKSSFDRAKGPSEPRGPPSDS